MAKYYTESDYENAVLELMTDGLGYEYLYGPDIVRDYHSPLYDEVLESSLRSINRKMPEDAILDALFKLRNFENGGDGSKEYNVYGLFAKWYSCKIF